jgi:hypothetical protein
MQNMFLLLSVFVLASCGIEVPEEDPGSNIGQVWEASESANFSDEEVEALKSICTVLEDKENYYKRIIVNSTRELKYKLKETKCGAEKAVEKTFKASVVDSLGKLSLSSTEANSFKDILMKDSREMSELCDESVKVDTPISGLPVAESVVATSRIVQTGSSALRYFIYDNTSNNCKAESDEVCMYIEVGNKLTNGSYKTTDIHAFKISLNSSNNFRGVVMERAFLSSDACDGSDEKYTKEQFYMGYN